MKPTSAKETEKFENLVKKIAMIHNEHSNKEFIVNLYIQRQNLEGKINFMDWWLQERERNLAEDPSF